MLKSLFLFLFVACVLVKGETEGVEGDICLLPNGDEGVCTEVSKCLQAVRDAEFRRTTKICGFSGVDPIVCCVRKDLSQFSGECDPKTPRRPDLKFGRKAYEKCLEYQEQVIFPCTDEFVIGTFINGTKTKERKRVRTGGCTEAPRLIIGSDGIDASRGQFPHMALLGYGGDSKSALWGCGGTIVSEKFILSAAHCTMHRELGKVAFARLGILKRKDPVLVTRLYKIARFINHPEYKAPIKYNDIALLETEQRIKFVNRFVSPACLDINDDPRSEDYQALATGWGAVGNKEELANVLQIMALTKFTHEECSEKFYPTRILRDGINNETQMCYGHRYRPVDTCEGDSGGPLQTDLEEVECMHKVIGITSFGNRCGRVAQPRVYTRVLPFVPWIESIVWPETS